MSERRCREVAPRLGTIGDAMSAWKEEDVGDGIRT
jgi:hypothetical protein